MSRLYWHTQTRTGEVMGWEHAWLRHLAAGPGAAAWDLDGVMRVERAAELLALVPETAKDGYLHKLLREAQAMDRVPMGGYFDLGPQTRLISGLQTALDSLMGELPLHVAGAELGAGKVALNTAIATGSDPIRLATRVFYQAELHAWVEEEDREWVAGMVDTGRRSGVYRADAGWEDIAALLRDVCGTPGPVVLSYSVGSSFPNASVSGWMRAGWPEGRYPDDPDNEWVTYDTLTEEEQHAVDERGEAWDELDRDEQWRMSMEALRRDRPWGRIQPKNFDRYHFGPAVTIYDLFASDRDERVRRAAGLDADSVSTEADQ